MITRYKTPLLIAVIVLFFVYLFVSGRSGHQSVLPGATIAVSKTGNPAINTIPSTQPGTNIQHVTQKQLPVSQPIPLTGAIQPNEYVAYMSGRLSGIIGMYAGNQTDNPVDNVFTVEIDRNLTKSDRVWLNYKLTGVNQYGGVSCSVNDRLSFGGHLVSTDSGTYKQRVRLHPDWLQRGDNHIRFGLAAGATYGYKVSDLAIEIERVSEAPQAVIVNNSRTLLNGKAYIHGFINSDNRYKVEIDGRPVALRDGEFEAIVQPDADSVWLVASYKAKTFRKLLRFDKKSTADFCFELDTDINKKEKLFAKNKAAQIETNLTTLTAPVKTILETRRITATDLRPIDLPALDLGMTNVTAENRGVRFLPHGEHFGGEGASVALKYDRTRIPDGYTEDDIRTFYFDPNTKHWVALERDTVDKSLCMVVSKTTHFTDMINGVIQTPESPETQGFAPTMLTDIKAADPTSKINLIAPPTANNQGSANLTYELELPPTHNGMNPNLSITYNSDGGSGWLGEGWDLNIPTISVDTRWGVPRYDPKYETETYNLNGVMLATVIDTTQNDSLGIVSVGHKGVLYQRLTGKSDEGVQFHPVSESNFSRITRLGSGPGSYYWKVVTKEGLIYTYGGTKFNSNSSLKGTAKTFQFKDLTPNSKKELSRKTVIAEWKLSSIEDQYGNFCRYYYTEGHYPIYDNTVKATGIWLNKIEIGRYKSAETNDSDTIYQQIRFYPQTPRTKRFSSARYGFLTSSDSLHLDKISILVKNQDNTFDSVRSYSFQYKTGAFDNILLDSIKQLNNTGKIIASHKLNYYNNILSDNFYRAEETIRTTSVEKNSANPIIATTSGLPALGGSKSENKSGSFYLGVGADFKLFKIGVAADVGYNHSKSSSEVDSKMVLVDINGDGLPDKVYKGTDNTQEKLYFIPNLGDGRFGPRGILINGYSGDFSKTTTNTIGKGWKGSVGAEFPLNVASASIEGGIDDMTSTSNTKSYMSDVNNDGLIDIVSNGTVYFNSISSYQNGIGIPSFSKNSGITPRPILNIKTPRKNAEALELSDSIIYNPVPSEPEPLIEVLPSDAPIQRDSLILLEEKNEYYDQIPMQDIVRFWEAPRAGKVTINTNVKYLGDINTPFNDGVRLAIQTTGTEIWNDSIIPFLSSTYELDSENENITVVAGQRIFFRLQSGSQKYSDNMEDVVLWKLKIRYNDEEYYNYIHASNVEDENGYVFEEFESADGAFVSQNGYTTIDSVFSLVNIHSGFVKPQTSDSVHLKIYFSTDSIISRDSLIMDVTLNPTTGIQDTTYVKYKLYSENPNYAPEYLAWEKTYGPEAVSVDSLRCGNDNNITTWFEDLGCPQNFRFEISGNTNNKWDQIKWTPKIVYTHFRTQRDTIAYAGTRYVPFVNVNNDEKYRFFKVGADSLIRSYYNGGQMVDEYGPKTYINEYINPNILINSDRPINAKYTLAMYKYITSSYSASIVPFKLFHGKIINNQSVDNFIIPSMKTDNYVFKVFLQDTISSNTISSNLTFSSAPTTGMLIPSINCYQSESKTLFGHMWRGWGQFQYNAANGRYSLPIKEDSLFLPKDTSLQALERDLQLNNTFIVRMNHAPFKNSSRWVGSAENLLISGDTICTGRLNETDMPSVLSPDSIENTATSAPMYVRQRTNTSTNILSGSKYEINTAPVLSSRTKSNSKWGGASAKFGSFKTGNLTYSTSSGETYITNSFMDLNGDGFPDYITDSKVEFTNPNGGLDGEVASIKNETTSNDSWSIGFSGENSHSFPLSSSKTTIKDDAGKTETTISRSKDMNAQSGINPSISISNSTSTIAYTDMNGDGLPDRIFKENNKVFICYNQGYSFSDPVELGVAEISLTRDESLAFADVVSLGGSYVKETVEKSLDRTGEAITKTLKKLNIGLNFSVNGVLGKTYNLYGFVDVNLDGLPDKLYKDASNKTAIEFNTGNGFTPALTLEEIEEINKSYSTALSANLGINISIKYFWVKFSLGLSGSLGWATNYPLNQLMDIDGDGFPDVVKANNNSEHLDELKLKRSVIGTTNKLKSVTNPFGGVFRIDYKRSDASYDHPGGKWVMNSLTINDGITDDGDSLKNEFSYEGGKYDRYEREFLGFAAVTTENINTGSATQTAYRKLIQTFDNSNYYTRGALLTSTLKMIDGSTEKTYTETINKYRTYSVTRVANSANGDKLGKYVLKTIENETDFTRENLFLNQYIVYAPTKYSLNKMYAYKDGIQSSLITSESYYDYYTAAGTHGELSLYLFSDKGNLGENASNNYNYKTEISYLRNKPTMTLFSLPESYTVTGNSGKLYRKTEAVWFDNFATQLKEVRQIIGNGDTSKVTLGYDRWGNLSQKELPAKNKADRMWYKYEYDKHYHLFPVKVSDKLGYSSTLSNYDYRFGIPRTTTDMNGNISTTTLDNLGRIVSITGPNEYDPNDTAKHTIKFEYYPGAVTKNTNGIINNPAYAVTRHYDPVHPTDSIITVTFVDGFGRPVQVKKDAVINGESKMIVSGRTRYDALGRAVESYYPTVDELSNRTTFKRDFDAYKTVNTYDVLDRVLTTRLPDGATTTMSYGIAAGKLVTTVVDAEGGKQQTFTNGSGLTVKTLQYKHVNPDTVLTTLFDYDGVNQLVKVTDDAGKITESIYDLAGRRTQVTHPASGITKFEYDVAGNLIAKQTANMLANNGNKKIQYFYAYNRLDSVVYPDHPENNVKYTYGAANDPVATRRGRLVSQEDGSGAQEFSYGKQGELTQVRRTLVIPNQAVATYVTGWKYDSWNRLLEMTYPDGEKVNYSYNTGGLLTAVASSANTYVSNIHYDKFEQRTSLTYGNGAVTTYQYDPANRQLNNLSVVSNNTTIMNNTYGYDNVGNIDSIVNTGTAMLTSGSIGGTIGGKMKHVYKYDKLYRLKEAHGTYNDGITAKAARYDLYMGYDNMHNIVSKKQHISQTGVQFDGTLQAGYDLNYTINANNSQQIANIAESNYRTEGNAANTPVIKESNFIYDANGNLLSIYSGTKTADDKLQVTQSRNMLWDEENRLLGISDNGYVSNYWYDASGERTVKMSGGSEGVAINGVPSVARTETKRFTAYISPYLTVRNGGEYTKHVYMGNERITSKVSNSGIFSTSPVNDTLRAKYQLQTAKIKERFDTLGVKYNGSTQSGGLISNSPSSAEGSYFYHSDHLGSSSLITSQLGDIVQHLEYVPFGETFIDQRNGSWNTPYLFNGKERDEETGLLYVHARYQDSKYGIWYSVDPLAEKYPNVGSYVYCFNNPIKFIDPTGLSPYYDKNGNHLGNDEKGFKGKIYITTKSVFDANSKDGTANSKMIQTNNDTKFIRNVDLSNEAEANIYTNILSKSDFDTKKLHNGSVSIYNMKTKNNKPQGYNDPNYVSRFNCTIDGNAKLSIIAGSNRSDLYTVESIISFIGVHEFMGHGIKLYNDTYSHYKAYLDQYQHKSFKSLPLDQQNEVIERVFQYMSKYNPNLYKNYERINPLLMNKYRQLYKK